MTRSRTIRPEQQTLDAALRAMFSAVETRVVPDDLRQLVDRLEEASRQPEEKAA
jgi:hypothetical protein